MNRSCAVTGSFDPITIGHLNIIERAKELFDTVYVLMLINPEKKYLFTTDERLSFLKTLFNDDKQVKVYFYSGFTADFCREHGIKTLVRGIRNEQDLIYEKNLAKLNYDYGGLETCFFVADEKMKEISSSLLKDEQKRDKYLEIVPEKIRAQVKEKFNG